MVLALAASLALAGCLYDTDLEVWWSINGTEDGTHIGPAWDLCSEVGASEVLVRIDGEPFSVDCHQGGNMAATFTVIEGVHRVEATLQADQGRDITTTAAGDVTAVAGNLKNQIFFDFFFYSFLNPIRNDTKGRYHFSTTFEKGLSCGQTSPPVAGITVALYDSDDKGGGAVVTDVCDAGDKNCFKTTGASPGNCINGTRKVKPLTWGLYKMVTQGGPAGSSFEVCWERKTSNDTHQDGYAKQGTEILVGAGDINPQRNIDLARINTTGNCR
jgi:hypothetical protein